MRLIGFLLCAAAAGRPLVFPEPQKMTALAIPFALDEKVTILVPPDVSPADLALARALAAELSDRYGLGLRVTRAASRPSGRFILIGTASNSLIHEFRSRTPEKAEGYFLRVSPEAAIVAGYDDEGAFYGMQSLRQAAANLPTFSSPSSASSRSTPISCPSS
jgi:glycosyl hydrolase family 20